MSINRYNPQSFDPVKKYLRFSPYKIFWALKDDWWKSFIDGKYHKHGAMVFDKGLHGKDIEPGFYFNLEKACRFASAFLLKKRKELIIPFYKKLHRMACAHFSPYTSTVITKKKETGEFLRGSACISSIEDLFLDHSPQGLTKAQQEQVDTKIKMVNRMIFKKSKLYGASRAIAQLVKSEDKIYTIYTCPVDKITPFIQKLFDRFRERMQEPLSEEQKITNIAELFQMMEWLHPFKDGQGRVDLILLNTLLCKYGLHPVILKDPYVSTCYLPLDWEIYLKQGLKCWDDFYFCPKVTT